MKDLNFGKPIIEKCAHCHKPRGEHNAMTKACPVGRKTRIGVIAYSHLTVFSQPSTKEGK